MADVVWAFIERIGKWKPIENGKFRIINRGKHKGWFLVRYMVGKNRWRPALTKTIRVPK